MKTTIYTLSECFVLYGIRIIVSVLILSNVSGCNQYKIKERIDLSKEWRFSPDENNVGVSEKWFDPDFDDSNWVFINAGTKWEEQGFRELDSYGWYRKKVEVPTTWKGHNIWLKFAVVNDAYTLFINGEKVSYFGEANISVASRPTYTELSNHIDYGKTNQIAVHVHDWGGSGGLWRLPVTLTTDKE